MTQPRLAWALALFAALPAAAQNAITIYGGWRGGGGFEQASKTGATTTPVGLASGGALAFSVDRVLDAGRNLQFLASTQRTTLTLASTSASPGTATEVPLTITYLHIGGSNFIEGKAGRGAYVAGGLGATWMSPRLEGLQTELRPSMSLAFGWEQAISPAVTLRAEVRGYATLIQSSGGFFCSGGCTVVIRGDSLFQADTLIGLSARF